MKFTEEKLENVFTELLWQGGFPSLFKNKFCHE